MKKTLLLLLQLSVAAFAQWSNGYTYKANYVVNNGQVSGTLNNFTVVVAGTVSDFKTVASGGKIQQTCTQTLYGLTVPADLIFTSDSAGTSLLTWQFDTYNASTGAYSAHVLMPAVAVGSVLYAWYGKTGVSTCQGGSAAAAWDGNTVSALATPNGTTLNTSDYLGNSVSADTGGVSAAAGLNSGMASFAGSSTSDLRVAGMGQRTWPYTVCAFPIWTTSSSGGTHEDYVVSDFDSSGSKASVSLRRKKTGDGGMFDMTIHTTGSGGNYFSATGTTAINSGVLHQVCGVVTNTNMTLYVDGAPEGAGATLTGAALDNGGSTFLAIGNAGLFTNWGGWNGRIAEINVSNTNRSASWISARYNNVSSPAAFWAVTTTQTNSPGSFTVSPAVIPSGHTGNLTLTLAGTYTAWTGSTVLTLSGVANVTKVSQNVISPTSATVVVTTGAGTGTLTVQETVTGVASSSVSVAAPSFSISPLAGNLNSIQTVTLTGGNTVWTQESAGFLTLSGGSGASLGTPVFSSDTAGTVSLTVGTSVGTLTLTDTSTGKTATFAAGGGTGSGTCAVVWGR